MISLLGHRLSWSQNTFTWSCSRKRAHRQHWTYEACYVCFYADTLDCLSLKISFVMKLVHDSKRLEATVCAVVWGTKLTCQPRNGELDTLQMTKYWTWQTTSWKCTTSLLNSYAPTNSQMFLSFFHQNSFKTKPEEERVNTHECNSTFFTQFFPYSSNFHLYLSPPCLVHLFPLNKTENLSLIHLFLFLTPLFFCSPLLLWLYKLDHFYTVQPMGTEKRKWRLRDCFIRELKKETDLLVLHMYNKRKFAVC